MFNRFTFATALATLFLSISGARAAPQILGVVASAEPIPMHCAIGTCAAELSAFCMEQERTIPTIGTRYQAIDPKKLTLVVTSADGAVRRISAAPYLSITSQREYYAVTASVPESAVRDLGGTKVALTVGPQVTLVPMAEAGDAQPLTEAEITRASTAIRAAASQLFDGNSPKIRMARVMNRLINVLPLREKIDRPTAEAAWLKVTGAPLKAKHADPVLAKTADAYEQCNAGVGTYWPPGLRRCLEVNHDEALGSINVELWKIIGAGS